MAQKGFVIEVLLLFPGLGFGQLWQHAGYCGIQCA